MPSPLSVAAATIPAISVPCPFGSLVPSPEPSTMSVAGTTAPCRSDCDASAPVARTATVALEPGLIVPKALSQLICGRDHWFGYCGSFGAVAVSRERSAVTETTSGFAASVCASAESSPAGNVRAYMRRTEMAPPAVPFAAAMSSCCCASEMPLLKVTMYGTDPAAGELLVVSVELEEVSVELEAVSVVLEEVSVAVDEVPVSAELTADASVPVSPVEVRPIGEMPPNAPDTNRPVAKRTAIPSVPLTCHFCALFFIRAIPSPPLS